jgi:RNA polymerase sigma-B factor
MTATPRDELAGTSPCSGHRRDIDGDVEVLAIELSQAETCEQRAQLQERIVLLALPLADAIARRYAGRGIDTDDLLQVARTALVKAIHRYRPGTGAGFAAFATPTISGELKRCFRDQGWSVRPPRRVQELRSHLVMEEERMRRVLSRQPRDDELAAVLGVTVHDIAEVRLCSAGYRAASLDAITSSGSCLADHVLVSPCPTEAINQLDALGWAVARLSERQRTILRLRFIEERTQAQIGEQLGMSQMQVSRLLRRIVEQLRRDLADDVDVHRRAPNAAPRTATSAPVARAVSSHGMDERSGAGRPTPSSCGDRQLDAG